MKTNYILVFKKMVVITTIMLGLQVLSINVSGQYWGNDMLQIHSESLIKGNMDNSPFSASLKSGNTLYFTDYYGFEIYDVTDIINPTLIGRVGTPGSSSNFVIHDNYVYVADWIGFSIISIADPSDPQLVSFTEIIEKVQDIEISGDYVFLGVGEGVYSYNITDPEAPFETDYLYIAPGSIKFAGTSLTNDALYYGNMLTLFSINYNDPTDLQLENQINFNTGGSFWGNFAQKDNYLYAASSLALCIYDISDPFNPTLQYQDTPLGSSNYDVKIDGDIMCVAHQTMKWGLFDISNPIDPVEIYLSANHPFNKRYNIGQLSDDYAFFLDHWQENGNGYTVHIFDISSPDTPEPITEIKSLSGESLASCLLEQGGFEYALVGQDNLTESHNGYVRFLDVTDAGNPILVATLEVPGSVYDITTDGSDYAFIRALKEGTIPFKTNKLYLANISDVENPYLVFDYPLDISFGIIVSKSMSALNNNLYIADKTKLKVFSYDNEELELIGNVSILGGNAFGIKVPDLDNAFVAAGDQGLHIYNITNPGQPLFQSWYDTDGLAFSVDVAGNYAYVADGENGLVILDISGSPIIPVSQIFTTSPARIITVSGTIAYVSLENGYIEIIDVSTPGIPVSLGTYNTSGSASQISVSPLTNYLHVADELDFVILEELFIQSETFTNVTNESGINLSNAPGQTVVWLDYNNDGWQDFYGNTDQSAFFFENNGDGSFTDIISSTGLSGTDPASVAVADFDKDGYDDLLIASLNMSIPVTIYRNLQGNGFQSAFTGQTAIDRAIWLDFEGDGDIDIFCNTGAYPLLYLNDGNGDFIESAAGMGFHDPSGISASAADMNNDGFTDIYCSNYGTANRLYLNLAGEDVDDISFSAHVADFDNGVSQSWGDYDQDGYMDLYASNIQANRNNLYKNLGDETFEDVTYDAGVADHGDARTSAWVDFDNDGLLDLFTTNHIEPNMLFKNNGDGTFTDVATDWNIQDPEDGFGISWADYDHDGDQDILISGHTYSVQLLRNDGYNTNHYLDVQLQGIFDNTNGIGSRITLYNGENMAIREMNGGRGARCQDDLRAHFGLGNDDQVDSLLVRWPSGMMQMVYNIEIDQNITIVQDGNVPPTVFHLISPGNDSTLLDSIVTFVWSPSTDPDNNNSINYELRIFSESCDTSILNISDITYTVNLLGFCADDTLYWMVKASDGTDMRDSWETWKLILDEGIGISESNSPNDLFVIFPNPASDQLTVGSRQSAGEKILKIFDFYGRKVKEFIIPDGQKEIRINVSTLPKGMYLVRFESYGSVAYNKVIIQ